MNFNQLDYKISAYQTIITTVFINQYRISNIHREQMLVKIHKTNFIPYTLVNIIRKRRRISSICNMQLSAASTTFSLYAYGYIKLYMIYCKIPGACSIFATANMLDIQLLLILCIVSKHNKNSRYAPRQSNFV